MADSGSVIVVNDKEKARALSVLAEHQQEMHQLPRSGVTMYTTWPDMIRHWPKTTLCIVSNEFCERFSYYGMRTVLTFYLLNVLKFSSNTSTIFFNSFTILCYLTPLLGSVIADGYIGKFWTIFSVSILYAIGQIILAVASTQNFESSIHPWLDLTGLVIIGFGTGGIKPCVSAFGADQFEQGQEKMLSVYFSMFYFSINAGSMISTFISPIFRATPCMGQDTCYPLAFGVPAVLMVVATALFMAGSYWYKKPPPTENIFAEVGKVIYGALRNKFSSANAGPTEHWLEHYLDTHVCDLDPRCVALQGTKKKEKCQKKGYVSDIRALFRLMVMFLPVPVFWALYDQQGSVWLIQAIQMDCDAWGIMILPDQMQTLNAVLILVFIPIFQTIIYPIFSKCLELTPLRKMVAGGWLAALSFLVTGLVQLRVNQTLPQLPSTGSAYVGFMNVFDSPCDFTVTPVGDSKDPSLVPFTLHQNESMVEIKGNTTIYHIPSGDFTFNLNYSSTCVPKGSAKLPTTLNLHFNDTTVYYVAVGEYGAIYNQVGTDKPTEGTGEFAIGLTMFTNDGYNQNLAMCRLTAKDYNETYPCNPQNLNDFQWWELDYNDHTDDRWDLSAVYDKEDGKGDRQIQNYVFKDVKPGIWGVYFLRDTPKDVDKRTFSRQQTNASYTGVTVYIKGQGGVYQYVVTGYGDTPAPVVNYGHQFQVVQDNQVNILWQVPQIVLITAAEILFSITGYEFAYSQSAPSMKALVQALWLLTTAGGDAIIVLITALNLFDDMAIEFFAYAIGMFVVICIFALMSIFYYDYQYYTKAEDDEEEDELDEIALNGKAHINNGYLTEKEKENPWETDFEDNIRF